MQGIPHTFNCYIAPSVLPCLEDQGDVLVKAHAMEVVENKQGECLKWEETGLQKQFQYGAETKETWKLRC